MSDDTLPETVALVLHFRDAERTSRCLASLAREEVRRVLVVDNSDDGGVSLARLLGDAGSRRWPGLAVDVFDPGTNLGFSAGVNRGLARIGELLPGCCVLLLNSDAELGAGCHEALRAGLREGLQLASATMASPGRAPLRCAYYQPYLALLSSRRWWGSFRYLSACCFMLAPALATPSLFDERFFFYGEDIALGWRLTQAGITHDVVEGASVDHEGSAAAGNGSLFYEYHMARAHLLLPRLLSHTRVERWIMLTVRLFMLPLRATVRSVRSRTLVPWRGLLAAAWESASGAAPSIKPGRG